MISKLFGIFLFISNPVFAAAQTMDEAPENKHSEIRLSNDLLDLLRQEMLDIAKGIQTIALSLAIADWKSIQDTSIRIRDSYIMNRNLTPKQARELEQTLPEKFKELDAELHHRAEKLATAADAHDRELAVFQYSRLIESCTTCHSSYAGKRFPGFAPGVRQVHH